MKAGYAESCGVEWECLQESGSLVNGALSTPSMTLDLTGCPSATLQATIPFTKINHSEWPRRLEASQG